ncbi:hypothetical protein MED121_02330 [Marinomonas sp. MED121]|uniref:hypothetical protein n=1 Tax=Marinomonas sp. MED121 TaxID=314277 RepID=UPI0000690A8E|nr:hypothetical protein [Marinomonas sp. MED121]EAQ66011.1 hypothetical protein MED121_02330 [Marinomonas sp. MED121]
MIKYISPKKLLDIKRLDIALKILYIDEYLNETGSEYLNLYKKHIELRTSNLEDDKECANDFIDSFNLLIQSINENGFDDEFPIHISSVNHINLSGAHRLACALYFNLKVIPVIYDSKPGLTWCSNWFSSNNFSDALIKELELKTLKSMGTSSFIIWNSLFKYGSEIEKNISLECEVIKSFDIKISSKEKLMECVSGIYSYELGPKVSEIIISKAFQLSKYKETTFKLIVTRNYEKSHIIKVKEKVRKLYSPVVNDNLFLSVHSSDDVEHSNYLLDYLLNFNRYKMPLKNTTYPSIELIEWLSELYKYCENKKINRNDICIVGSSSMDILGIRKSTDIDFILLSTIREKMFDNKVNVLSDNIDLASKGYLRLANTNITDDLIIKKSKYHYFFRGFKFIDIDYVLQRKKNQCRDKDIQDVRLIDRWKENNKTLKSNYIYFLYEMKFKIWYYFVAKPRIYKGRIKFLLRKILPENVIQILKRIYT